MIFFRSFLPFCSYERTNGWDDLLAGVRLLLILLIHWWC
jgi:hypothetical protein